jgi:hypothetical protein
MIKILPALIFTLSLLFSHLLNAQDKNGEAELKYYDVEIIIFRNDKVPRGHELNLPTPSASIDEKALDLSSPESIALAKTKGFVPLKAEELRLQGKAEGIDKSSRYTLLLHTGWRQPGVDKASAIPVWIKGGKVYSSNYSSIDQFSDINNTASISTTENAPKQTKGLYELEGQITVTLSRYLHTNAELVLRKPATPIEMMQRGSDATASEFDPMERIEGQLLLNHSLNEKRRMRSKKLHYLDSPEFGMLVLITPYQAAEQADAKSIAGSETVTAEKASSDNPG